MTWKKNVNMLFKCECALYIYYVSKTCQANEKLKCEVYFDLIVYLIKKSSIIYQLHKHKAWI